MCLVKQAWPITEIKEKQSDSQSSGGESSTIGKCTSAFVILKHMLEKYQTGVQNFLKYLRDIRITVARSTGWFKYDELRMKRASQLHS
jgi:hypothetical protein